MLDEIGSKDPCLEQLKAGHGRLMGFGHRVYKNYGPRARTIKWTADQVFEVTGRDPKLEIALELRRIALDDEYFMKRKLYPNVDFYSGIIYRRFAPRRNVYGAVCDSAHRQLACVVAGDAPGSGAEDCPSPADLYRKRGARVCAD
jgi:citrate synthase